MCTVCTAEEWKKTTVDIVITPSHFETVKKSNHWDRDSLPIRDSRVDLISLCPLFRGSTVSRADLNDVSFIQRFHCTTRDTRPDPNVSFIQRFQCTTRDSRPDPNVSFIQMRFLQGTVDLIPMCPLFRFYHS